MVMSTTVKESEWGTSKDPSACLSDETLRTYAKRGLTKKLADKIVYRLTPEVLKKKSVEDRNYRELRWQMISKSMMLR